MASLVSRTQIVIGLVLNLKTNNKQVETNVIIEHIYLVKCLTVTTVPQVFLQSSSGVTINGSILYIIEA